MHVFFCYTYFHTFSCQFLVIFTDLIVQEDGVVFREESGGNNERIGQYRFLIINSKPLNKKISRNNVDNFVSQYFQHFLHSYIDDKGKTITVKYSAGINGFRYSVIFVICV